MLVPVFIKLGLYGTLTAIIIIPILLACKLVLVRKLYQVSPKTYIRYEMPTIISYIITLTVILT